MKCATKEKPADNHTIKEYVSPSSPTPSSEEETEAPVDPTSTSKSKAKSATENDSAAAEKGAVSPTSPQCNEFEKSFAPEENF